MRQAGSGKLEAGSGKREAGSGQCAVQAWKSRSGSQRILAIHRKRISEEHSCVISVLLTPFPTLPRATDVSRNALHALVSGLLQIL